MEDGFTRLVPPEFTTRSVIGLNGYSTPRLENAIKRLEPAPTAIDPHTNFLTVYTKAAEKHYDELLQKYAGDLDTSQIFVSKPTSLLRLSPPQPLLFLH